MLSCIESWKLWSLKWYESMSNIPEWSMIVECRIIWCDRQQRRVSCFSVHQTQQHTLSRLNYSLLTDLHHQDHHHSRVNINNIGEHGSVRASSWSYQPSTPDSYQLSQLQDIISLAEDRIRQVEFLLSSAVREKPENLNLSPKHRLLSHIETYIRQIETGQRSLAEVSDSLRSTLTLHSDHQLGSHNFTTTASHIIQTGECMMRY